MRFSAVFAGLAIVLMCIISSTGCSGNASDIIMPDGKTPTTSAGSHNFWGLWQFTADPDDATLDITQLRTGDFHLNAIVFLEPPPFVNLSLESLQFNGNIIEAGIGLRHPFLGLDEFTGFDVSGILITNGSITGFTDSGIRMAGPGDTRLLNPDGHSRWWNPAEFPVNTKTMSGYNDGLLGTPDAVGNFNSTVNAYKYFCGGLATDDPLSAVDLAKRGSFPAGQKIVRHYTIELGAAGLIFNYAVDASWQFPQGEKPWVVPDSFGPAANRAEAWRADFTETTNTLWNDGSSNGGNLSLSIDIYDWFNIESNTLRVESPGSFPPIDLGGPIGGGPGYSTYEVEINSATPPEGEMDVLLSVASEQENFGGFLSGVNTTAYFLNSAPVSGEPGLDPICDIQVITPMPYNGWGIIEFDASGSQPVNVGDILSFEWDFDGDGIYGEICDDNYIGDSDHPFHKYESNYIGDVWVRVSDDNGGESECSVAVDVTAHQTKNIPLRTGVKAFDIGVDPSNSELWVGYSDHNIYKYTEAGWYQDPQYRYQSQTSTAFDRMDTAADGWCFYIVSSATQVNGSAWIYDSNGTIALASGWGGGDNWLVDVANYGTTGTYANDLMLFVGYFHTYYSVHILMVRGYLDPNYTSSPCNYTETWIPTYTGPTYVFHEWVKGMDTGIEGTNMWFLEAPDYYCSAFTLTGSSYYKNFVYNNSYFGAGSEQTGDTGWTDEVRDIAHDADGRFHVLDYVDGQAVVKVFTGSSSGGTSHGSYGDECSIAHEPQRIDGSDDNGMIFVLHGDDTDGYFVSIFLPDELP